MVCPFGKEGDCRASGVVYLITCTECNEEYIGETGRPALEGDSRRIAEGLTLGGTLIHPNCLHPRVTHQPLACFHKALKKAVTPKSQPNKVWLTILAPQLEQPYWYQLFNAPVLQPARRAAR
ncbi:unnamed protein product [Heligmosomoides polygyrus]|uniref:Conjugal transfer protein n=1 Tax=Heligmosomoides polygyrus TaxID=6339 RepID=A0A183GDF8_HELPZ|nr:unnamed protein product [Heligmosomoides polygyrus]